MLTSCSMRPLGSLLACGESSVGQVSRGFYGAEGRGLRSFEGEDFGRFQNPASEGTGHVFGQACGDNFR
jgi:hypothetical protein